ncbi:hypothetical protein COV49_03920 [Candidatus Falkowbacteria bacterium CG11_big_fil_rev_8_21_14_0_20_39_10]|uniref:Carbonic anhydrase n=1 Tax=Candidatus Falkowbacteria bacterium CG11_big_fil_rev_8_21_14_0_20_39_10 TaxID=1974570 RepID=A0A2M6K8I6_9BACT|nr:MAG: hypothetical protein COV49_03920 [Candidatus Falkowbacteria bacterium CG11_big_fil_rev_8_21_14_0_20_39_10]
MDFRLVEQTRKWMKQEGLLGDSDEVSLAGASKEIVDGDEQVRELLLKQIKISCDLHCACQVVLLHHSDCGAYKASYNFKSKEEEKQKQLEDMAKVEGIIKERFKGLNIIKIWAQMKDDNGGEVEFYKV